MANQVFQTSAGKLTPAAILNQLVADRVLTPAGLAWLKLACDPWHDTAVNGFTGMPDQGIGKSVTFQVVREYQISKVTSPTALPAGNWSVRIGNFPILENAPVTPGLYYGDVVSQAGTASLMVPVQVNYAAEGADFVDTAVGGIPNAQGCSLPNDFTKGLVKVCGVGIEVINTTSTLHKQGLMSCCRMVQPEMEPFTAYIGLAGNLWSFKTLTPIRTLPKNLAEMALYPGYAQEEAKDGYYAPVALKFGKNRNYPVPISPLLLDDDPVAGAVQPLSPISCYTGNLAILNIPGNTTNFWTTNHAPLYYGCDSNTVMFTGLSDETTLTLRVRYVLERFPSDAEGQILVIANDSATYDPVALQIYSQVVQRLPAGTPFTDNPSGEWWMKMLTEIGRVAAPLIKSIPHPLAQGIGAAIDLGLPLITNSMSKKEKKAVKTIASGKKNGKQNNNGKIPANPGPKKPAWHQKPGPGQVPAARKKTRKG